MEMKDQDMKKIKLSKSRFIVVWMRNDIISKVRFNKFMFAINLAKGLNVPAHVYSLKTYELLFINKYCGVSNVA